ncbi:MAG TPA: D-arabinono-1,4-lactone oxidase [Kofleriaceae bacterium]|nr:D-arabinono-1,4-lactone oxidase [Kofleriaceae bacterium]
MAVRNYGRNVQFSPARRVEPTSADELARIIRESRRVRAVGAAHSWSPAIVTDGALVSLDRMRSVIEIDRAASRITVQGGMRLRELNQVLAKNGLALANLGSIDSQSVAGVIATGTHGTGRGFRCLSAQVARLDLIDGTGGAVTLERGHPDFAGAVVALGALGIVHAVTFDVVPAFQLHDVTRLERFDDIIERIDEHVAATDHFKVWWFCPHEDAVVFRFTRTDQPANDSALRRWFKDRVFAVAVYRTLLAVGHLSRRRWIPRINKFLVGEAGRPLDRISASHIGFLTPIPPVHREAEWAFDVADARPLIREYRRLLPDSGHTYNFIQELRFSKADDLWLSPAYQRDSIWLSLYNIDRTHWPAQLAKFEAFARAHGGRPHWGKEHTVDREYLRAQYPRLDDFAALAARYDPERKFRNDWLDRILA